MTQSSMRLESDKDVQNRTSQEASIPRPQGLISVIIPVYNVSPYLGKCLDSLRNQSFTQFDVVLVDDGSTDSSGAICDEYAARDNRITVIHTSNKGLSAARNTGIEWALAHSPSTAIAFIDSDDWIATNYLAALWEGFTKFGKECSCCVSYTREESEIGEAEQQVGVKSWRRMSAEDYWMIPEVIGDSSCWKLFSKAVFLDETIRFPVGKWYEDTFIIYKILFSADVAVLDCKLYMYTSRKGSITFKFNIDKNYDALEALTEQEAYFNEKRKLNALKMTRERLCVLLRTLVSKTHNKQFRNRLRALLCELRPDFKGEIRGKRVASLYRDAWPIRYRLFGHLSFVKNSPQLITRIFRGGNK